MTLEVQKLWCVESELMSDEQWQNENGGRCDLVMNQEEAHEIMAKLLVRVGSVDIVLSIKVTVSLTDWACVFTFMSMQFCHFSA